MISFRVDRGRRRARRRCPAVLQRDAIESLPDTGAGADCGGAKGVAMSDEDAKVLAALEKEMTNAEIVAATGINRAEVGPALRRLRAAGVKICSAHVLTPVTYTSR